MAEYVILLLVLVLMMSYNKRIVYNSESMVSLSDAQLDDIWC